jgi:hypothetical protein
MERGRREEKDKRTERNRETEEQREKWRDIRREKYRVGKEKGRHVERGGKEQKER